MRAWYATRVDIRDLQDRDAAAWWQLRLAALEADPLDAPRRTCRYGREPRALKIGDVYVDEENLILRL